MKVKIIEASCYLSQRQKDLGITTLETQLNGFLIDNPDIDIVSIKQSSASSGDSDDFGSKTIVSIFYNQ